MSRLLLGLIATVVGLLLAEGLLRGPLRPPIVVQRDADWQLRTRQMHALLHQPDEELIYIPRPGRSVPMDYGEAAFNHAGLRGPEPSESSRVRVVMLGDSLVWGELLAEEHTLSARLREALDVEVLNAGVTGYDTTQELGWYRRQVRPLHPDVVVVVYCLNDMLTMSGPLQLYARPEVRQRWLEERIWLDEAAPLRNETISRLWLRERSGGGLQVMAALRHVGRWLRLFTLPSGYVDEFLLASRAPARAARTLSALSTLGAEIRADGAAPILVISPALYWWHRYQWESVHAQVAAAGRAAGFVVLDPQREGSPEAFRFPGDNLHYNPAGAVWLATQITPLVQDAVSALPAP